MSSTIVAQNSAGTGGGVVANCDTNTPPGTNGVNQDLLGTFISSGFNLIGTADGTEGFTNSIKSDLVGAITEALDPLLGPLQMNGGPTPTHALLPGSPAIDQGYSFGRRLDQRGRHRPFNFSSVANGRGGDGSDIGAYELQPPE